jgi:hypothetical protein
MGVIRNARKSCWAPATTEPDQYAAPSTTHRVGLYPAWQQRRTRSPFPMAIYLWGDEMLEAAMHQPEVPLVKAIQFTGASPGIHQRGRLSEGQRDPLLRSAAFPDPSRTKYLVSFLGAMPRPRRRRPNTPISGPRAVYAGETAGG